MPQTDFSNDQLNRYSRHLLLPEIDLDGQARLQQSKVVIIGAGGLASPAAMYLAGSGIGSISIFDHDNIEISNLQRQIAFTSNDLGKAKATQLKQALEDINPEIQVTAHPYKADQETLSTELQDAAIAVDASDNFETRFMVNEACHTRNIPLVSGAAIRFSGQLSVFDPRQPNTPCYRCLYPETPQAQQETCRDRGVFAPLVGIIGSMQAAETLKLLLNIDSTLIGGLLQFDAKTMTSRVVKLPKDPHCPLCSQN